MNWSDGAIQAETHGSVLARRQTNEALDLSRERRRDMRCEAHIPYTFRSPATGQSQARQAGNAALQPEVTALPAEVQEFRLKLSQNSSNSSRPPSPARPKLPSRAKRRRPSVSGAASPAITGASVRSGLPAGEPGRGGGAGLCCHCRQPFPKRQPRRQARAWRHQVEEWEMLAGA